MSKVAYRLKHKKRSETPERKIYNLSSNSQRLKDELNNEHFDLDDKNHTNNPNNLIIEDNTPVPHLQFSDLLFNVNDDFKTLITKNTKLRGLLIEANTHITDITNKYEMKLEIHSNEKKSLLLQLDKITANYSIYAESHKNLIILKEEYDKINSDFSITNEKNLILK